MLLHQSMNHLDLKAAFQGFASVCRTSVLFWGVFVLPSAWSVPFGVSIATDGDPFLITSPHITLSPPAQVTSVGSARWLVRVPAACSATTLTCSRAGVSSSSTAAVEGMIITSRRGQSARGRAQPIRPAPQRTRRPRSREPIPRHRPTVRCRTEIQHGVQRGGRGNPWVAFSL